MSQTSQSASVSQPQLSEGPVFVGLYRTLEQAVSVSMALADAGVSRKMIDIVDRASDGPAGTPGESFYLALDRWFPDGRAAGYGVGLFAAQTLVRVRPEADVARAVLPILNRFGPIDSRKLPDVQETRLAA